MRRIAAIGDIHGCYDEFLELLGLLEHHSLDAVAHVGDLVDRGPDSGAVVEECRKRGLDGVMGNHESALLARRHSLKDRTCASLRSSEDWRYVANLPRVHVYDDLQVVLVHGGLYPKLPLWKQPQAVMYAQLINPDDHTKLRWWGTDKHGVSEEENRKDGFVRWYEICDDPYLVVYGHSVFKEPFRYNNTLGIDTGCVFGNCLTAVILPDMKFVTVKAKKVYNVKSSTKDM